MPDNPQEKHQLLIELAKRQMEQEMPQEMKQANIAPEGWFDKLLHGDNPNRWLYTTPFNSIKYRPEAVNAMTQTEANDLLAHELTHVRQFNEGSPSTLNKILGIMALPFSNDPILPYGQEPQELEAFQVMKDRATREGRTQEIPSPSFTGSPVRAGNIELKPEPKRNTANGTNPSQRPKGKPTSAN